MQRPHWATTGYCAIARSCECFHISTDQRALPRLGYRESSAFLLMAGLDVARRSGVPMSPLMLIGDGKHQTAPHVGTLTHSSFRYWTGRRVCRPSEELSRTGVRCFL